MFLDRVLQGNLEKADSISGYKKWQTLPPKGAFKLRPLKVKLGSVDRKEKSVLAV